MDQDKRLGSAVRWLSLAALFGVALTLACAGANGDPAPEAPEAGAPGLDPCVEAGATE
ncbi:MAG: hypothetical protein KIS78_18205 [Labilithrix sp.]|nr:hypothetical protein [Labilithrix sp.]MCW5834338.1 hypothetical protein [Labilithrix sp.]